MRAVVVLTLVLSIIAVALGGAALALTLNKPSHSQLANVQSHVNRLQTAVAQVQSQAGQMDTTTLSTQMQKVNSCLPELYAYLSSGSINGSYLQYPNGNQTVDLLEWPASINWGPQLSLQCQSFLSPGH